MCLIALALDAHPKFGVVIAANRDEYFRRPAEGLDWWRTHDASPWLLGGRDLDAGGTWMAMSEHGRVAMLTNVRDPARHRPDAASRGELPVRWLHTEGHERDVWPAMAARGCNPFNLIGGDLLSGRWWWADDRSTMPQPLAAGLHALSNASLGTPWPKVQRLREALGATLDVHAHTRDLTTGLFDALGDRAPAADIDLPDTGIGIARERMLSPAFIVSPDGHYGTRCSTVMIGERLAAGWRITITERAFDAAGRAVQSRQVEFALRWAGVRGGRTALAGPRPAVQVQGLSAAAAPFPGARCPLR